MKIIRIRTIAIQVPIKPDLAIRTDRSASQTMSSFLLVRIQTDDGLTGLGEVSCQPKQCGEDQVTAAHFIDRYLSPMLLGEDPREVFSLTRRLRAAFAGNYFTKAGVEMALWDIAGKAAGKPVHELLGGKVREFVPLQWPISGVVPRRAAEIALQAVSNGFKCLKVKVGVEPNSDVARVHEVRKAVGAEVMIGIDANGVWSPETAVKTIERILPENIFFAQQPVPPEDVVKLSEVRRLVRVPIVAGESIFTRQDAITLAHLKAADVFSIHLGRAGGLASARSIATFAELSGLQCTLGSDFELGVGTAAMIQLALATPGIAADKYPCEIIGPYFHEDDIIQEPLPIKDGQARSNDKPGLGVELDDAKVERYRVAL